MQLAYHEIIPPKEWQHDPNMVENTNGDTVAIHLAVKGIIPPKCWKHRPDL